MSLTKAFRSAALAAVILAASSSASMAFERVEQPSSIPGAGPWDERAWNDYYSVSQGSRLIPWDWIKALKQADGQPFLADGFARYGYLANPASPTPGRRSASSSPMAYSVRHAPHAIQADRARG